VLSAPQQSPGVGTLKPTVSGGGVRPRGICIRRGQAVPNELGGTQSCLRKPPGRLVPNQSKGSRSNSGKRAMVAATEPDSSRATCAERTPTVPAGSPLPARKHARRWQTSPGSGSIADGPQKSVSVSLRGRRFGAAFDTAVRARRSWRITVCRFPPLLSHLQ
jgi:hypothetical protein